MLINEWVFICNNLLSVLIVGFAFPVTFFVTNIFGSMAQHSPVGHGLPMIEASRSHSDTPHSVGLLCTSDQPEEETATRQHTTSETDIHAPGGIQTRNPSKLAIRRPTP
jgi:hypothetical protein